MADYDILPATLAALQPVINKPQGTEAVSVLDDYLRQTRTWLYMFLSDRYNQDGTLKPSNFSQGGTLPSGTSAVIRGTNPVDQSQREIIQGTIHNKDLLDATIVASAKIAPGTIVNTNIAAGTIDGSRLADASITTEKIAVGVFSTANLLDGAITGAKIALGTITADRIVGNTISKDQMGARSVLGSSLPLALRGEILVGGNGVDNKEFAAKKLTGVVSIDEQGVTTLAASLFGNALTYARIVEKTGNNQAAGASVTGWNRRGTGNSPPWQIVNATRDFLETSQGVIYFKESGKYLIQGSSPTYGTNGHKTVIIYAPNPTGITDSTLRAYFGTEENGAGTTMTRSYFECLLDVTVSPNAVQQQRPFIILSHWVQTGVLINGLGIGSNVTQPPPAPFVTMTVETIFADMHIMKVQDTPTL